MKYLITNIKYDTDGKSKLATSLPKSMVVEVDGRLHDDNRADAIGDAISNRTGFCHFGFEYKPAAA